MSKPYKNESKMLQALGSSTNAKIAYIMFSGCCVLIIGTFIFVANFERTTFDNSYAYCATAYFSPKTGYRVEYWGQRNDFDKIDTGCARACYKEQKSDIGLSFLEIETQTGYADHNQAYAAGVLEGTLTWMSIYAQWKNTIQSFCEKDDTSAKFCTWLRGIIERNHDNIIDIAKEKHAQSKYQHQIYLFYQQLYGIERGFKKGVKRARKDYEISTVDFLLLNARVDIDDLKIYYNKFVEEDVANFVDIYKNVEKMIINLVNNEDGTLKLNIGHSSDGEYSSMLKIVKTYRLNYHEEQNYASSVVPNTDITFTSYPGIIASTDDFYLAEGKHTRMIIAGIKMKHNHPAQIHGIDLDSAVLMSVRVMAANRLAENGKKWAQYLARDPDIGAKQWLFVDEKGLKYLHLNDADDKEIVTSPSARSDELLGHKEISLDNDVMTVKDRTPSNVDTKDGKNIIWLIDNTWKRLHGEDVTARFKKDGAWICDGTPYFKVIQELNKIGGKDLKLNEQQMTDEDDIASILRQQAYRGDLMGSEDDEAIAYGNTDIKIYSTSDRQLSIQNGPIYTSVNKGDKVEESNEIAEKIDIFEWQKFSDVSHDEHPEAWNFPAVHVQYIWN